MKVTSMVHVPARDVEVVSHRVCDFPGCGQRTTPRGSYEIDKCEVKISVTHKEGSNYPEGGSGTELEIDICPECFTTKLLPWLKAQGVEGIEREWEW
jgi:hypothetical protein